MIQISRIVRFTKSLSLSVAVMATSVVWAANASSQMVDSEVFEQATNHSILEVAEEVTPNADETSRFSSVPLTKIDQGDAVYDAPAAPLPRKTSVKPFASHGSKLGGNSSGTFVGSNPRTESANNRGVNSLRESSLRPVPKNGAEDQPQHLSGSSISSFSDQPSSKFASSSTGGTNGAQSTISTYVQTSGQIQSGQLQSNQFQSADQANESKYESAYLHDQQVQPDTPVADLFGSPNETQPLEPTAPTIPTAQQPQTPFVANSFQAREKDFVQQTAYLSPAAPVQQFQDSNTRQNNQQFGQQPANQRRQQNQSGRQQSQGRRTRQRELPRQNQSQNGLPAQNQQQPQTETTGSNAAKEVITKFSFDANQQLAQGLPIRMADVLKQSAGRVSRSQLIPQYWEVYYDWAQSVSAKHHHDWVASLNSAKQADASSLEIAQSNAQNEIKFSAIQLGKSQAKMKSLTGSAQPIVPMDSPTVTRVKTNYEAFKSRGMIAPKFEGIDSTLQQMHALIASRADTVSMAQRNANEAKQLYSRNQSTIDQVLTAGRTWRSAESDFIASVIEYNQAYADYALALPYGRGPVDAVVNMLIVKSTTNQSGSGQLANGRPNLSNGTGSNSASYNTADQNSNDGNDYSIPYGSSQPNTPSNRSVQSHQSNSRQANPRQANTENRNGSNNTPPAFGATRSQTAAQNNGAQNSAANSLISNTRQQTPLPTQPQREIWSNSSAQQSAVSTNQPSQATNRIQRPSQFPTNGPSASSPFSSATGQSQPPQQSNQRSFGDQRPQTQPPASDKTAGSNPFSPVRSADRSAATPTTPKPPASAGGFNFGG